MKRIRTRSDRKRFCLGAAAWLLPFLCLLSAEALWKLWYPLMVQLESSPDPHQSPLEGGPPSGQGMSEELLSRVLDDPPCREKIFK
jgi:hypothetical protein